MQTLIKRLVTKDALTQIRQGRVFIYTPVVNESADIISQALLPFIMEISMFVLSDMVISSWKRLLFIRI